MHPALLNGHPKITVIESFDNSVTVIRSKPERGQNKKVEFHNLKEAKAWIEQQGLEINVSHIFGSNIQRLIK